MVYGAAGDRRRTDPDRKDHEVKRTEVRGLALINEAAGAVALILLSTVYWILFTAFLA